MGQNGWAEEARAIAAPTLLSLGGFGQNDVPVLNFLAWCKAIAIGRCLDASLAVLAAIASQAAYVDAREAPPNLRAVIDSIRDAFPPVKRPRALGADCQRLTEAFARHVFAGRDIVTG
jgi:histidine ammonia-lyase